MGTLGYMEQPIIRKVRMNTISQGVPSLWLILQIAGSGVADRGIARTGSDCWDAIACDSQIDRALHFSKFMVMGRSIFGSLDLWTNRLAATQLYTGERI